MGLDERMSGTRHELCRRSASLITTGGCKYGSKLVMRAYVYVACVVVARRVNYIERKFDRQMRRIASVIQSVSEL